MSLDELIRSTISRVGVVHVRNVLNPFLWSFVWSIVFLSFAVVFREDPPAKWVLLCSALLPMIVTMIIGCFFAVTKPERLQSEEYRLRQRALQILYKKGSVTEVVDVMNEIPQLKIETKPQVGDGPRETES